MLFPLNFRNLESIIYIYIYYFDSVCDYPFGDCKCFLLPFLVNDIHKLSHPSPQFSPILLDSASASLVVSAESAKADSMSGDPFV